VERKPGARQRHDVARERGFRGQLLVRVPIRERRGDQPRGADRGSVDGTPTITRSELSTEVKVDGLDDAEFQEFADGARSGCAVSRALAGVEITLAKLA